MEALPLDHDASRHSSVHRGAARVWADASHSHQGTRSEHGIFVRADGSAQGSRAKKSEAADAQLGVTESGWPN